MNKHSLRTAAALVAATILGGAAAADTINGTLAFDRWYYPFATTPTSAAALFGFFPSNQPPGPAFGFNRRDGQALVKFNVALPPAAVGQAFEVTSARLEWYDGKSANWALAPGANELGGPTAIEVFAAGFGPTYSEASYAGTETYVGGAAGFNPSATGPRDPYPRDLATDGHAEDNVVNATPWAVGVPDVSYVPGSMTNAFKVTATFDVNDETIQQELQQDLVLGRSTWLITSTYFASQTETSGGNADPKSYPRVLMTENMGNTDFGTSQLPPALIIEIALLGAASAEESWAMYE